MRGIKASLKEIPEANAMHLAGSHPHFALCEPVILFRLLMTKSIVLLLVKRSDMRVQGTRSFI